MTREYPNLELRASALANNANPIGAAYVDHSNAWAPLKIPADRVCFQPVPYRLVFDMLECMPIASVRHFLTHKVCVNFLYAYGMSIPVWASCTRIGLRRMHMGRPYAVWVNS